MRRLAVDPHALASAFPSGSSPFNSPSDHSTLKNGSSMDYASVIVAPMLPFPMFAARRPLGQRQSPKSGSAPFKKTPPRFSRSTLRSSLTLFHSVTCRLLPLSLKAPPFVFSNLQPLVPKQGGMVGYTFACLLEGRAPIPRRIGLCFHDLTNPSFDNPFLFTSIQIPRGVSTP